MIPFAAGNVRALLWVPVSVRCKVPCPAVGPTPVSGGSVGTTGAACRLLRSSQNEFPLPEPSAEKALNNCNKLDYSLVLVISLQHPSCWRFSNGTYSLWFHTVLRAMEIPMGA